VQRMIQSLPASRERTGLHVRSTGAALALVTTLFCGASGLAVAAEDPTPLTPVVIVDPGHGGDDLGAIGPGGALEKKVALAVAQEVGAALQDLGVRVVYTRTSDRFVSLAERTTVANGAHGDFCLSIHANASPDPASRGLETYFLSVEASDQDALQVAMAENQAFKQASDARAADVVGAILGDLAVAENMRMSRKFALALHEELDKLPGPSRGVKQAQFVVLSGVSMPSALLELGFLTNKTEEKLLINREHQKAIAVAVARGILPLLREVAALRTASQNRRSNGGELLGGNDGLSDRRP
jgi:N-acetylmuramoyl-L-alanine amidase